MLYPSIKELTKGNECRYSLVIATSKIARELSEKAEQEGYLTPKNSVSEAVKKIAEGKISYREAKK